MPPTRLKRSMKTSWICLSVNNRANCPWKCFVPTLCSRGLHDKLRVNSAPQFKLIFWVHGWGRAHEGFLSLKNILGTPIGYKAHKIWVLWPCYQCGQSYPWNGGAFTEGIALRLNEKVLILTMWMWKMRKCNKSTSRALRGHEGWLHLEGDICRQENILGTPHMEVWLMVFR